VANDLRKMDPALFQPELLNLKLRPARETQQ
jgi:hypothetical protein